MRRLQYRSKKPGIQVKSACIFTREGRLIYSRQPCRSADVLDFILIGSREKSDAGRAEKTSCDQRGGNPQKGKQNSCKGYRQLRIILIPYFHSYDPFNLAAMMKGVIRFLVCEVFTGDSRLNWSCDLDEASSLDGGELVCGASRGLGSDLCSTGGRGPLPARPGL